MTRMTRGFFLALEGMDGCGKTTQSKLLAQTLSSQGYNVLLTQEPTTGRIGRLIREELKAPTMPPKSVALLFAADRLEHWAQEIEPALKAGKVVICDRYVMSSLAYQGALCRLAWVEALNMYAPRPDLTVYLQSGRTKEVLERREEDDAYERDQAFQTKVQDNYFKLMQHPKWGPMTIINASVSPEETAEAITESCLEAGL